MFIIPLKAKFLENKHPNMNTQFWTLFNELLKFIPKHDFYKISGQLENDKWKKTFSTRKTFLGLFLGEIIQADSIRWLCDYLDVNTSSLYHLWLTNFSRSTFSDWINKTPSIIFQTLFYHLLKDVQINLGNNRIKQNVSIQKIYSIDSTIISLTLSIFNWAYYRTKKGWIKIHTRLNMSDALPDFITITEAKVHDSKATYSLLEGIRRWDVIVFDRWYLDYSLLHYLNSKWITFVTRTKRNTDYCPIKENTTHWNIIYDAECEFISETSMNKYPEQFRIIRYYAEDKDKEYEYITNNFQLAAEEIAELYKQRRQIELLFKRLKQHLKIKQFFWTTRNAVENQIRVALIYYLIVNIVKIKTQTKETLLAITRKIKVKILEKVNLLRIINCTRKSFEQTNISPPQWSLFVF